MYYFLKYSRLLTEEELKQVEEDESLVKKDLPGLSLFKKKIVHYEEIYATAKKLPERQTYCKWLKVDENLFKMALLHEVKRWSWIFKKHLLDELVNSLENMAKFIETADKELEIEVVEGDYDNLIKVMKILKSVRDKQSTFDVIFDPMREIILIQNTITQP